MQGVLGEDAAPRLGEGEEAAGDSGDPLGHADELRTQPGDGRVVLVLALHAQQVHGDHRQGVIDLVRHAGGQRSHRGEPRGALELVLELLALRDVTTDDIYVAALAGLNQRDAELAVEERAIASFGRGLSDSLPAPSDFISEGL